MFNKVFLLSLSLSLHNTISHTLFLRMSFYESFIILEFMTLLKVISIIFICFGENLLEILTVLRTATITIAKLTKILMVTT